MGIHTGLVVGKMGGGTKREQRALGETPNLAARLQGLATPDTVVTSAATDHPIQGLFECQKLGLQLVKGFSAPVQVYRIVGESGARSRMEVAVSVSLTPQRQCQKTLEAMLSVLLAMAVQGPLLLIVEDLHWIDPSTVELLSLLIEQSLALAQSVQDPARPQQARLAVGSTLFHRGQPSAARTHLEEGMVLNDPHQPQWRILPAVVDPRVAYHAYATWTLWHLGYPDQAYSSAARR